MYKEEKGYVLPSVLMIILTVTLLITAVWRYSMSDMEFAEAERERIESYYLASSAVNLIADLDKDPGTYSIDVDIEGRSHTVVVEVSKIDDVKTIESTLNSITLKLELYKNIKYWRK